MTIVNITEKIPDSQMTVSSGAKLCVQLVRNGPFCPKARNPPLFRPPGRTRPISIHNSPFPANTATGPNARYALQRRRDYESNRHCQTCGRPGKNCHSKGDPKDPAYPRGRPVADIIDTVGEILLFYVGFGQKAGVVVVHSDDEWGRWDLQEKTAPPGGYAKATTGRLCFQKTEFF